MVNSPFTHCPVGQGDQMFYDRKKNEQHAKEKLLQWQPTAHTILVSYFACPCCYSSAYLSYSLPDWPENTPLDETLEYCGFYCAACGFDAAGARKKSQ